MTKNKFIQLITSNNLFAFFYIMAFMAVLATAVFTGGNIFWAKLSWLMLALLGVFITATAFVSHEEARQSKRWPTVPARLLRASVRASVGSDDTYAPDVEYEFTFNGKQYRGSTYDYSAMSSSEAWATKAIQEIKDKGVALTVHVNPENPEKNVLNSGVRLVHYLRYLIGPAMTIASILAALDIIEFK